MLDVLTIGSATRDVFVKSSGVRVVSDARAVTGKSECVTLGAKVPIQDLLFTTGGAGTNSAVTFARQKLSVSAVVRLGRDANGIEISRELEKEKIGRGFVQHDKKAHSAYSIILIAPNGERTIFVHRGANDHLSAKEIPWKKLKPKWVYLNSLSADFSIIEGVIRLKKKTGCYIAWNPGGADLAFGLKKLEKYIRHADVFIVNQEEASELLGVPYSDERGLFKKFDEVVPGLAIMTKGHDGVTVSNGTHLWQAGIYKEKRVADRTGAGDAFCSGFVAALIHASRRKKIRNAADFCDIFTDKDIAYAIRLGSANGTSVVEQIGAKKGILRRADFLQKRWKSLEMKKINLH